MIWLVHLDLFSIFYNTSNAKETTTVISYMKKVYFNIGHVSQKHQWRLQTETLTSRDLFNTFLHGAPVSNTLV